MDKAQHYCFIDCAAAAAAAAAAGLDHRSQLGGTHATQALQEALTDEQACHHQELVRSL